MFNRFSDRARKVMGLARQEAQRFNHEYIGTEHILVALVAERRGIAAKVLEELNVDLKRVRVGVAGIVGKKRPTLVTMVQLPFTPSAKKVLELTLEEASLLGDDYIGTQHLLLGIIRQGDGIAAQVLSKLGVELETVRAKVLEIVREAGEFAPQPLEDSKDFPNGPYHASYEPEFQVDETPSAPVPRPHDERASPDRGVRRSMGAGALYDAVLAIAMLTALPLLSRLLAIPMPPDPLFVRFNALLLFGVALFYALGAAAPGAACLRFAAGTIAFRAGGGLFVAAQVPLAHAPAAFLLVGAGDLAFAAWTWAELRFRVRAQFWPLLLRGEVVELGRDVIEP
jgi:ClpA/ClpB-like protein